jgi:hypothetical protein
MFEIQISITEGDLSTIGSFFLQAKDESDATEQAKAMAYRFSVGTIITQVVGVKQI